MLAFLGVDRSDCACEEPCPSVAKFVKLYLYRAYVRQINNLNEFDFCALMLLDYFLVTPIVLKDYFQMVQMRI